ncbi:MAG: sugar isomerase domain-containing protein, partial [Bacillota bacterium]
NPMLTCQTYLKHIQQLLDTIALEESGRIEEAARMVTDAITVRDIFHVIGTGAHGSMVAEELLWRAGGLACVNAILDPSINLIFGAYRSGIMDQTACNCDAILDVYGVMPDDLLIIVNSSGVNAYSIELAKTCRKRGIKTIAITSKFGLMLPEPKKESLFSLCDMYIDNHMPYGDSAVTLNHFTQAIGPVSSILNIAIANMIICQAIENLLGRGIEPPVWQYDASPGSDINNKELFNRYQTRIHHL